MGKKKTIAKVYIDGSNVFYSQKKMGWTVDWQKVRTLLSNEYQIIEFRYYTGVKNDDEGMKKYLRYLNKINFITITKPLKMIKINKDHQLYKLNNYDHIYKSNFDVEISVDMILDCGNVEGLILFSGDSDFQYLVKKLKDAGKKVIVYSSRKTLSWELKLEANKYRFLEDNINLISK